MGCCCSSAAVLMDEKFPVNGSAEDIDAKLRTPKTWVELIPRGSNGENVLSPGSEIEGVDHFIVLLQNSGPYAVEIHNIQPFKSIEEGYSYKVSLGGVESPEATFDVQWTYTKVSRDNTSTIVRRRITNFKAHTKLCLPWTLVMKSKCAQENATLQQMFK